MRITARMIADQLGDQVVEARIPDECPALYGPARILLPDENVIPDGQAFIVSNEKLAEISQTGLDSLIITEYEPGLDLPCPAILCRGKPREISVAVIAAFAAYNELEEQISASILEDLDLDQVLAPIARFFSNPVQVYAPIFKAISSVRPILDQQGSVTGAEGYEQAITPEIVYGMLHSLDLQEDVQLRNAHYCRYPVFECGCFQVNLYQGDKMLGRLVLIEEHHPFTIGTADTLNIIAKYIRYHMAHRNPVTNASHFTVEYSIAEILSGRITDSRIISSLSAMLGWPSSESSIVLFFHFSAQDLPTKDLSSYHVQALSELLPHSIVMAMDDGIVAVARSRFLNAIINSKVLESYLTTADMHAGQSEPFTDFRTARPSYLQARTAVRLGTDARAPGRIYKYQDNAVDHIVSIAIESGNDSPFIHPSILLVEDYDRENQTDLLTTLRIYLETQCNQVASATRLHIHRNSMKYRLQQLNEIMGFDLRSTNQQLRLLLSILIRERQLWGADTKTELMRS